MAILRGTDLYGKTGKIVSGAMLASFLATFPRVIFATVLRVWNPTLSATQSKYLFLMHKCAVMRRKFAAFWVDLVLGEFPEQANFPALALHSLRPLPAVPFRKVGLTGPSFGPILKGRSAP